MTPLSVPIAPRWGQSGPVYGTSPPQHGGVETSLGEVQNAYSILDRESDPIVELCVAHLEETLAAADLELDEDDLVTLQAVEQVGHPQP